MNGNGDQEAGLKVQPSNFMKDSWRSRCGGVVPWIVEGLDRLCLFFRCVPLVNDCVNYTCAGMWFWNAPRHPEQVKGCINFSSAEVSVLRMTLTEILRSCCNGFFYCCCNGI